MIYCNNLVKTYGSITVLKGTQLEVPSGQMASIMGSSGAGKSTLLHIIGTLDQANSGTIKLNGVDVASLNSKDLSHFRNQNIGFIFQFHHLLPELTALENTALPAYISGQKESLVNKRASDLLDYLGMKDRMQHKPGQLSGGEQQRIALARALINSPKILLADEPTGNLDQHNAQEVLRLLLQLKSEMNMTLLLVTHDPNIAMKTEITYTMKDGIIVESIKS